MPGFERRQLALDEPKYVAPDIQGVVRMQIQQRLNRLLERHAPCSQKRQEATMLFTIAVILLVLWLLGLVSGYTLGNFIYVLLVIALVLFVVGLVSGRRTV
jgi:Flp pilus assembly protein TadB